MISPRRILVTGGNKGIGKAICEQILRDFNDTYVFLCSRNRERGEEAIANIVKKYDAASRIELLVMDVSDSSSVSNAVGIVKDMFPEDPTPLYSIVNNAALGFRKNPREVLATNFYGACRTNEHFMPLIQNGGRIVHMASASGPMYVQQLSAQEREIFVNPQVTLNDIYNVIESTLSSGHLEEAYGFSKACLNMYNTFLARTQPRLVIAACTPGFIDTDMTAGMGASGSVEDGSRAPMFCLMSPEVVSGAYYGSDSVRSPLDCYRGPGDPPFIPS